MNCKWKVQLKHKREIESIVMKGTWVDENLNGNPTKHQGRETKAIPRPAPCWAQWLAMFINYLTGIAFQFVEVGAFDGIFYSFQVSSRWGEAWETFHADIADKTNQFAGSLIILHKLTRANIHLTATWTNLISFHFILVWASVEGQ